MRNKIVAIYLSLGPIIWFSSFVLGPLKRVLLVVIVLSFFFFRPKGFSVKHVGFVILLSLSFFVTILFQTKGYSPDLNNFFFSLIESYIFYIIGYNIVSQQSFNTDNMFVVLLLFMPFLASILTLTNFLFKIPNWTSPDILRNYEDYYQLGYEIQALWRTGFSWGRNGWGCSLALLLPFCFFLRKKSMLYTFWVVIFISILLCGNRNGLLAATLSFIIYFFMSGRHGAKRSPIIVIGVIAFLVISIMGSEFISVNLRLTSGDLSAGRFDQYKLIPQMLNEMGFWGMGYNGTARYLWTHGLGNHALHNTYFKLIIEFGIIISVFLLIIVVDAIKTIIKAIRSRDFTQIILSLVMISGLSLALFEPSVLFGSLGGYACWWFVYGYLSNIQNIQLRNNGEVVS